MKYGGVAILFFVINTAWCEETRWYGRGGEGYFWYQEEPVVEDQQQAKKEIKPQTTGLRAGPEAVRALEAFQKQLQEAEAAAVMNPDRANLAHLMRVQNQLMKKAGLFTDHWQRLFWTDPEFAGEHGPPGRSRLANYVYTAEKKKAMNDLLATLAQDYGLFFFFKSDCPYCHEFAPVVKAFAERYGFKVMPISLDGGSVAHFENAHVAPDAVARWQVKSVPAVYLIDPKRGDVHPIAYGMVSSKELEERIFRLMGFNPGDAFSPGEQSFTKRTWGP